ncbi:ABC transporter permease [Frigidibacter sp. MR17.24]|uniref:ABC transporter permease n=1 Tax=Frigidibacter sp. MR17.24 TaxID=3127345 RepID=UPI003012C7D2
MHKAPMATASAPSGRRRRAIPALMLREIGSTFGRSPGGYLWALAEPLGAILLLALCFSLALHAPPLGSSFALFYASGYLPFSIFLDISGRCAQSLRFSRPLMAFPAVRPIDLLAARFLLAALTHLVVAVLVLGGLGLTVRAAADPGLRHLALAYALTAFLGLGFGAMNCALFHLVPVWERIWGIATRPLFLVSTILFLPEHVPRPWDDWIRLNPVVQPVAELRLGLYPFYHARDHAVLWPVICGAGPLLLGLLLLNRARDRLSLG